MSSGALPAQDVSPHRRPLWGDERLALRVAEGDERAFAALYQRYHQRLFRYCVSILRDETDAHDALQSTFERALSALRREQRNAPVRPWLFRIAHNEAITLIRRRPPDQPPEPIGALTAHSAEHLAGERERLATLIADLAQLPERPRSALVMREVEGLSHEDIAIALDTTVGGAKQAIFEARRALTDAAEGREMSCAEIQALVSDGDRRVLRGRRVSAHLRSCAACDAFAAAIPRRRSDLRALAPPLAPGAAAGILAHAGGGLGAHGARSGLSAAAGSTSVGKGALAAAVGSKVAAGAAVLATATAGVAGVVAIAPIISHHHGTATAAPRASRHRVAAPGASRTHAPVSAGRASVPTAAPVGRPAGSASIHAHPGVGVARRASTAMANAAAPSPGTNGHAYGRTRTHSNSTATANANAGGSARSSNAQTTAASKTSHGGGSGNAAIKGWAKHTTAPASGGHRGHAGLATGNGQLVKKTPHI